MEISTRLAILSAAILFFSPQTAAAAQVTSSMGVGITIEPGGVGGNDKRNRRLFVTGVVTKTVPQTFYTWNAATISLKRAGFKYPRRVERLSSLYWFLAKRQGTSFRVAVSIASGRIVTVVPA